MLFYEIPCFLCVFTYNSKKTFVVKNRVTNELRIGVKKRLKKGDLKFG